MLRKTLFHHLLLAVGFILLAPALLAQRLPTASKTFDLQAGGDFVYGESDYGRTMKGYGAYATLDFKPHFGAEIDFHQVNATDQIYERTYEGGLRYVRHIGRIDPYAKVLGGRGVFNFPPYCYYVSTTGTPVLTCQKTASANLAYNLFAFAGGVDYHLKPYLNIRGDFEYQFWQSGDGIRNGLTPYFGTIGVAYHFR